MLSDADLIERAQAGDGRAWSTLVRRHGQLVYANARAVGADRAIAEDVTQLVWIRLLNHLDRIREPEKLRGWLAIVARNAARSEMRKKKPTVDVDELVNVGSDEDGPDITVTRSRESEAVRRGLATISTRCRELLTLLFSAEMSYEEISTALEMPIGSIGPTRQRCLASLATAIDETGGA